MCKVAEYKRRAAVCARKPPAENARKPPAAMRDLDLNLKSRNLNLSQEWHGEAAGEGDGQEREKAVLYGRIERLAARLVEQVPGLHYAPAAKIATAVASDRLDWSDVDRAIQLGRKRFEAGLVSEVVFYFIGAAQTKFRELGIPWDSAKPR